MIGALARKFFGSANERYIKSISGAYLPAIRAAAETLKDLDDDALRAKTAHFRARLAAGETLETLMGEAFAVVGEAAARTLKLRPYEVQFLGGIVLHQGKVAEMLTGEGKTFVATLPVYLNALTGKGVHVVTVNDYLARRDSQWMGDLYRFLGLRVGCLQNGMDDFARTEAYGADITYGTNSEFGFDYLRDHMKYDKKDLVQRPFYFALIDEVDSILIDEARTPLIISGAAEDNIALYQAIDQLIPRFGAGDFDLDEKQQSVVLTESGQDKAEKLLRNAGLLRNGGLFDTDNMGLLHHINQGLRAHKLFVRDKHYMIARKEVLIIDEHTGRALDGRRFGDGLHQAIEAKEKVRIQQENQTLASITYQNFFRLYPKLAGMTGTAMTEAAELMEIYKLDVIAVPPHRPVVRKDDHDQIFRTAQEKYAAVLEEIKAAVARRQPVLVGTISIEQSDRLSALLQKEGLAHQVLNARYHEKEASIIAQAGIPAAVTIATNMAGRGTDIKLGGAEDAVPEDLSEAAWRDLCQSRRAVALEAGGLLILGTERHESRRIDNQLRGRAGRQGDPGRSRFFVSLEDDLMRIFGSEKLDGVLRRLGLKEGEVIAHPWIDKALERAQKKVEAHNFEIRKTLLRFDNVMNDQRKTVYALRQEIMDDDDPADMALFMQEELIGHIVPLFCPPAALPEQWDTGALGHAFFQYAGMNLPASAAAAEAPAPLIALLQKEAAAVFKERLAALPPEVGDHLCRGIMLQILDFVWKDHLRNLDHLRMGINLRAYGQKNPFDEYAREAFVLFETMLWDFRKRVLSTLSHTVLHPPPPATHPREAAAALEERKVGRNDPCPCGSGKKYKHCCGGTP